MSHLLENFLSEKYKKNYYDHDFVRKADIKFKYLDGKIISKFYGLRSSRISLFATLHCYKAVSF